MIKLRTIITDIKDSLERLKRRMNMTEESISDSEDKTIEIAQSKKKNQKRKIDRKKELPNPQRTCGTITQNLTLVSQSNRRKRKRRAEKVLEGIMTKPYQIWQKI